LDIYVFLYLYRYVIPPELEASRLVPGEAIRTPALLTLIGRNYLVI
jgi:hypothetical protein